MTTTPATGTPMTNVPIRSAMTLDDQHTPRAEWTAPVAPGEIGACFPLAVRKRPACPPLRTRMDHVATAARTAIAAADRQVVVREAGRALMGAARIARDCQQPDLAQRINARHIGLYTGLTRALTAQEAAQVLGSATGLARAHLRTGQDPDPGVAMLTRILKATHGRLTIMVEGLSLPLHDVDSTLDEHRQLVGLARNQLVVGGTAALAGAGRWQAAADLARTYGGIDNRLLEGRQTQIIARLLDQDGNGARDLLAGIDMFRDENRDAATCLTALCARPAMRDQATAAMVDRYRAQRAARGGGYAYYRARHGSTVAVIAHAHRHPAAASVAAQAAAEALESADGYAAQEALRHAVITEATSKNDSARLAQIVDAAGLSGNGLTGRLATRLSDAVDLAVHAVRPDL